MLLRIPISDVLIFMYIITWPFLYVVTYFLYNLGTTKTIRFTSLNWSVWLYVHMYQFVSNPLVYEWWPYHNFFVLQYLKQSGLPPTIPLERMHLTCYIYHICFSHLQNPRISLHYISFKLKTSIVKLLLTPDFFSTFS